MRLHLACLAPCILACSTTPSLDDARWEALDTQSGASLRGVCALSDGVVWASGSGGTVLRSLDGGASWERFQVGVAGEGASDYRDIEALDAERAWVIAITEPAGILRTSDGGASWEWVYESEDAASFYDSIALFEGGGGAVFGDPRAGVFEVLRSDDGVAWRRVPGEQLPVANAGEAAFAASGTCVVSHGARHAWIGTGGLRARVLRSVDAGRRWSAADVPVRQGAETTGIYSVAFHDAQHGGGMGGAYDAPDAGGDNAAWSEDGGASWQAAEVAPAGYRSAAVWLDGERVLAVGRGGGSASLDGGRSWSELGDQSGYYALDVAPDGAVYAVGSGGRAARLVFERAEP